MMSQNGVILVDKLYKLETGQRQDNLIFLESPLRLLHA